MHKAITIFIACALLFGASALAEGFHIADANASNFGKLFVDLMHAYERPSDGDEQAIAEDVEAIAAVRAEDGELARAIAAHWEDVYLDSDYNLYLYHGEQKAAELEQSPLADSADHAFVVLGYKLKNGGMTDELKGRCDAAAAAARSYPNAMIVCSGGATGSNNPDKRTEAGLMKDYLVRHCGIDATRIFIDEDAMTTLQNAVNTLDILQAQGARTMTLVTSSYHQRWSQVVYNAMAEICRQMRGYSVRIEENYSFEIKPDDEYLHDDRWAIRQLCSMLELPDSVIEEMKAAF